IRRLFVGMVMVGTLVVPRDSFATSVCFRDPPCEYVLNPSKTAFVGTVVGNKVRLSTNHLVYEVVTDFVIEEVFGAGVGSRVSIATNLALTPEAAGTEFLPKGASYLVYAERKDSGWEPGRCSSPVRLADAATDLEVLRAARSGSVESSLSGFVSMSTWEEGSL